MTEEPDRMRKVCFMVSACLGVAVLIGALAVGFFRPAGLIDDSTTIVAVRKTGALYVMVDGRLHPVLNLVSAQLIVGRPDMPKWVNESEVNRMPRGPEVGIEGAPVDLPRISSPEVSRWAVCDTGATSIGGAPVVTGINGALTFGDGVGPLADDAAVLMSFDGITYLVHDGVRMPVDLGDRAVTAGLGISPGAPVQGMSRALFDAVPARGPIVVPAVANAGAASPFKWGPGVVVGSVVTSQDVAGGSDRFYVVLEDGVQQISPVVAAMLRQRDSFGTAKPVSVPPDRLAEAAVRHPLDVDFYPTNPVQLVDNASSPVVCSAWEYKLGERQAQIRVISGRSLPIRSDQQKSVVHFHGGGSDGVQADQVLLSDDAATFVTATGLAVDSPRRQTIWLISDSGKRFGVPFDEDSLRALGLARTGQQRGVSDAVRSAPWAMVQVWPAGPELSQAAANNEHGRA
jgi:type VII secretion protein EccB